jgi:hypothetical protein
LNKLRHLIIIENGITNHSNSGSFSLVIVTAAPG